MGSKRFEEALAKDISRAKTLLNQFPESLKRRTIELRVAPNEVISRIQQIDGVLIELQEKY